MAQVVKTKKEMLNESRHSKQNSKPVKECNNSCKRYQYNTTA
jgi:hypothetical protein